MMLINVTSAENFVDLMRILNSGYQGVYGAMILIMMFIISYSGMSMKFGFKKGLLPSLMVALFTGILLLSIGILQWYWLVITVIAIAGYIAFMR